MVKALVRLIYNQSTNPLLQRARYERKLRVSIKRLPAVIAYDLYGYIPAWVIRYYIAALLGGQEMETELLLRYFRRRYGADRCFTMPANIVYSHMYAS
jgi:hypothetical protein